MARQHGVRHRRERVDVDSLVERSHAHSLLGRHIGGCAGRHCCADRIHHRLGDAEVCDEYVSSAVGGLAKQQVSGAHVAMDDVVRV